MYGGLRFNGKNTCSKT